MNRDDQTDTRSSADVAQEIPDELLHMQTIDKGGSPSDIKIGSRGTADTEAARRLGIASDKK